MSSKLILVYTDRNAHPSQIRILSRFYTASHTHKRQHTKRNISYMCTPTYLFTNYGHAYPLTKIGTKSTITFRFPHTTLCPHTVSAPDASPTASLGVGSATRAPPMTPSVVRPTVTRGVAIWKGWHSQLLTS